MPSAMEDSPCGNRAKVRVRTAQGRLVRGPHGSTYTAQGGLDRGPHRRRAVAYDGVPRRKSAGVRCSPTMVLAGCTGGMPESDWIASLPNPRWRRRGWASRYASGLSWRQPSARTPALRRAAARPDGRTVVRPGPCMTVAWTVPGRRGARTATGFSGARRAGGSGVMVTSSTHRLVPGRGLHSDAGVLMDGGSSQRCRRTRLEADGGLDVEAAHGGPRSRRVASRGRRRGRDGGGRVPTPRVTGCVSISFTIARSGPGVAIA